MRFAYFVAVTCAISSTASAISWNRAQRQEARWFGTAEGRAVVENVLWYQLPSGGWPKNLDMARTAFGGGKRAARYAAGGIGHHRQWRHLHAIRFLARAYSATADDRVRDAFEKGLDYLFAAQYDNGGWPIYFPLRGGYENHIHFNDNSVSGVLKLMDDVAKGSSPFDFVDSERRERAAAAFDQRNRLHLEMPGRR